MARRNFWLWFDLRRIPRVGQYAAAGAVLLCLIGAWNIVKNPFPPSKVRVGEALGANGPATSANTSAGISDGGPPVSVPKGFTLWQISSAGGKTWFVLGGGPCAAGQCPTLLRSVDAGQSWVAVHTFTGTDTSAQSGQPQPEVGPPGALTYVLALSPRHVIVYGGDLWQSFDAGRSFRQIPHGNSTVLSVAQIGANTDVLTDSSCVQGTCDPTVQISQLPVRGDMSVPHPFATLRAPGNITNAHLAAFGKQALASLDVASGNAGTVVEAWNIEADHPVSVLGGACGNSKAIAAAGSTGGTDLYALCSNRPTDRSRMTVSRSVDGGKSWQVQGGILSLPAGGHVSFTAFDGGKLLTSVGGPREGADGTTASVSGNPARYSLDAGRSWHSGPSLNKVSGGGFDDLTSLGAQKLAATSRTAATYWQTDDMGRTWHQAHIAAPGD